MLFFHTTVLTVMAAAPRFFSPAGTKTFCVTDSPHWVSGALFLRIERHGLKSNHVSHLLPGLRVCGAVPPLPHMSSTGPLPCHFYPHTEQSNY